MKIANRIRNSKDGRTLASNLGYLLLVKIAGYVFPLITLPYLARVIGVEGFGKIAFAAAVVVWFQTVADWGFNYTATRDVAKNRDNLEKVSEIFSNVLWARISLMLLSLALLLTAIAVVPYFHDNQAILLVTFLLIPGHILFPDWFFQAMEQMKYITIFNLISKALFTALVFIFIKEKSDFILQPLFISIGYAVCGIVAMYIILVRLQVKVHAPRWLSTVSVIRGSTDVFISNIMPNLYNSFSTILLGVYGGSVSNGLLDASRKFVDISREFIDLVSRVFFPFLSRRSDKHGSYALLNLSITMLFFLGLFSLAPLIIKIFYTPEFYEAIPVLRLMCFFIIFHSLINVYGVNFMIIRGYEKKFRNITIFYSVIGFLMSFPLIKYYDYWGAAIVITAVRGLIGVSVLIISRRLT